MACRPLRWLWGLIPLVLIGLMVNYFARPVIETDLKERGRVALKEAGLPWAEMSFEGRDGVLSGIAFDDGARAKAIEIVQDTYGVRIVDDRASLVDQVDDFYWMATREDGRLRLKGFVPNDEMRKTVIGMASARFPGLEIDDRMRIARGSPSVDAWLSGVSFAFKQLGQLNSGRTRLDGANFSIVGEARDVQAFNQITQALDNNIPRGIVLTTRNVQAPTVSPYNWSAQVQSKQLILDGYVPSMAARKTLVADARKKFPNLKIVDRLTIAGGAPTDWQRGTGVALAALKQLGNGQATMTDLNLKVTGATKKNSLPRGIQDLLSSGLPAGFKNQVDIAVLETAPTKLDWRAVLSKGTVVLEGDVPDAATRKMLIERARVNFPGRRVINRMNIKSGVPREGWSLTTIRALDTMMNLSEGEATLSDTVLRVSGTASKPYGVEMVRETVTSYMPSGFEGYEFVKAPAQEYQRYNYTEYEEENDNWWRSFLEKSKKVIIKPVEGIKNIVVKPVVDIKKILESKIPVAANICGDALNEVARTGVVRFLVNSSYLNSKSYPTVDKIVLITKKCPDASFEISGHTDSDGSAKWNEALSLRRATSIVEYLVKKGVSAKRLTSVGLGESRPVAPNDTDENKARNRRIEFKVLEK